MEVKGRIIDYMAVHKVDMDSVFKATGIEPDRLKRDSGRDISADELCRLCVYLNVRPEDFYTRKIRIQDCGGDR